MLLDAIVNFWKGFDAWIKHKDKKDKALDKASASIRSAIAETQIYLGVLAKSDLRDAETEQNLARLWSVAARDMRNIEGVISDMCYNYSKTWADIDKTPQDVMKELEHVEEIYRQARLVSSLF